MLLLFDVYLIVALFPAVGLWFACFYGKHPLYLLLIIPFYVGSVIVINALHFVISYLWSLLLKKSPSPEHPKKFYNYLVLSTIDIVDRWAGIRMHGFDRNALPKGPCVFVCNHISNFDPMVTAVYLKKRRIIFLSKESNFRIPIAGSFINKAGYLCIDREDPREAMKAINGAVSRIADGISVGVYPEGTRSKTGELGDFKDGVFLIAKKAKVPVVVMTLTGTSKVSKNFFRRPTNVYLKLAGIIDVDTVASCRTGEISHIAREMVEKSL